MYPIRYNLESEYAQLTIYDKKNYIHLSHFGKDVLNLNMLLSGRRRE